MLSSFAYFNCAHVTRTANFRLAWKMSIWPVECPAWQPPLPQVMLRFSRTPQMWEISEFARRYYSLSFNRAYHFQWPWPYVKVSAVLAVNFDWKSYALIWLSCNLVRLPITSTKSWIYHYFRLSLIFKWDNWHFSWSVGMLTDTAQAGSFKPCIESSNSYQF